MQVSHDLVSFCALLRRGQLTTFTCFQLAGHKSVPLLIGGAASGTSILLSSMLMPFSVPVVSFTSDYIFVRKRQHKKWLT